MTKTNQPAQQNISLKCLCAELKIEPKDAREKLRRSIKHSSKKYPALKNYYKPGQLWVWQKDTPEYNEAIKILFSK